MKKFLLFLTLIFIGCFFIHAQEDDKGRREKIFREVQEFKMKYLAQEMDLSELQKKKFFEVYEEMNVSKQECYKEAVEKQKALKANKDASEEEYQQATEALNKANAQWADEEKIYNEKFAEFLSQKQIYKMREAENSFKAKLDEMRHSRKRDHHRKSENK